MSDLGVALVGAGSIANKKHLPAWERADNAKVTHIVDVDAKAAEHAAQRWGVPRWSTSLDAALNDDAVDAVDICTPFQLHAEQTIQCIRAGRPVILEKPLSPTSRESQQIADETAATGVLVLLCENWLYAPAARRAIQLIEEGAIGQPRVFSSEHVSGMSLPTNTSFGVRTVPGSYLINAGVHTIDCAVHFMGPFSQVSAFGLGLAGDDHPDDEDRELVVSARFGSGAIGSLMFSGLVQVGRPGIRPMRLIGDDGFVHFDIFSGTVGWSEGHAWAGPGSEHRWDANSSSSGHDEAIAHFVDCVRNGTPPRTPAQSFVSSNRAVDAILRSMGKDLERDGGTLVDVAVE